MSEPTPEPKYTNHTHCFLSSRSEIGVLYIEDSAQCGICGITHAEAVQIAYAAEVLAPLTEDTPAPEPLHSALITARRMLRYGAAPLAVVAHIETALIGHGFDLKQIDAEPNGGPPHETTHWGPDPAFGNLTRHLGAREDCSGPDCADDYSDAPVDLYAPEER